MQRKTNAIILALLIAVTAFGFGFYSGSAQSPQSTTIPDGFKVTGWVVVEVIRDGKVIYHHEGPNLITNQGKNILAKDTFYRTINASIRGATPSGTAVIALGNSTTTPVATNTRLPTEINYAGITRAAGTVNYNNSTQNTLIIRRTLTATSSVGAVQQAGLYNSVTNATATGFMAWNTFTSVNLVNNDQITITWTISLS